MKFKNIVTIFVTLVCALMVNTSCSSTRVYFPTSKRTGPPPHAPAYGNRRKQAQEVKVVYDSDLGVYVVVGYPDYYFYDGYYYRLTDGVWEMSLKIDGGWGPKSDKPLPPGLRAKGKLKNQGKAVAKGRGKHKGH